MEKCVRLAFSPVGFTAAVPQQVTLKLFILVLFCAWIRISADLFFNFRMQIGPAVS